MQDAGCKWDYDADGLVVKSRLPALTTLIELVLMEAVGDE